MKIKNAAMGLVILFSFSPLNCLAQVDAVDSSEVEELKRRITELENINKKEKLPYEYEEDNYIGDRVTFPENVNAIYTRDGSPVCIPAKKTMRGLGRLGEDGLQVRMLGTPWDFRDCNTDEVIKKNTRITIEKVYFDESQPNRFGLTYGTLFVPYKYHFSGSKSFNGNCTIGPYLGYQFDHNDIGLGAKLVMFAGAAPVEAQKTVDGEVKTETLAAFSYGVGLIGEIKHNFQMGVILGFDNVSNDSNYEDDNKLWGAVAIGFKFITK